MTHMLAKMLDETNEAKEKFIATCKSVGFNDEWDAYHNDDKWCSTLKYAHSDYIKKLHKFYFTRDGKDGFLGGRGC